MQLTVKTLKGEKFVINAELKDTISDVKSIIEVEKTDLPASAMKLIHSGKVLKDADTIESCNIKPNAFLVVMIAKARKTVTAAPSVPATTTTAASTTTTTANTTTTTTESTPVASTPSTVPSPTVTTSNSVSLPTSASSTTSSPAVAANDFPADVVTSLTSMGFPEAEVKACLTASQGNPDLAVEFLTNGIPPGVQESASSTNASSSSESSPLQALRNHPQINQLRRLVQSNPNMLQTVLTQIGQQQPDLLQDINGNQAAFLQIMNEPVQEETASTAPSSNTSVSAAPSPAVTNNRSPGGFGPDIMQRMSNPTQMADMLRNMSPTELQGMATMMGLTPEQLTTTVQMIGQMPPEQFQEYMNVAMQSGGGMPSFGGEGGGGDQEPAGGPQLLRLNEEEMAAVNRLADMGFDRTDAAQAYLACDKNEALAANLLMDGGFGFAGDADIGDGGAGSNDGDDMYD